MNIKELLKYEVTHKSDRRKNEAPESKCVLGSIDKYAMSDCKYKKSKGLRK